MVVAPERNAPRDGDSVSYDEERTYREAIKALRSAEHDIYDERLQRIHTKVEGLAAQIATRFEAMDKAIVILHDNTNRTPSLLDREVVSLNDLFNEKLLRVDTVSKEAIGFVETITQKLTVSAAEDVLGARVEAQTANDALQRLLEAAMAAGIKLADVRFAAQEVAITKTENAINTAMTSAQTAILAARNSAGAALAEVDAKSLMRHEAAIIAVGASELKVSERLQALQQLIELRARMNEDAVTKANDANEKRFESVNEFRGQQTDLIRQFVTTPVLDARMGQISTQVDTLDRQLRIDVANDRELIAGLSNRMTTREVAETTKREVKTDDRGGIGTIIAVVGGVVGVLGLLYGVLGHSVPAPIGPVGADTQRVTDLINRINENNVATNSRLDALSARMTNTGKTP